MKTLIERLCDRIDKLRKLIERRNLKVALGVICHAQAWLIKLDYPHEAEMLESPIRDIAKRIYIYV